MYISCLANLLIPFSRIRTIKCKLKRHTELAKSVGEKGASIPTKTISQGEGAHLYGQQKYVNSILSELETIRTRASEVLNNPGSYKSANVNTDANNTLSVGKANISVPQSNAGKSAGAAAQAASVVVPNTSNATTSSDSSTPIVTSVAAAETVTPQNKSIVDTTITPQTAIKANAGGELSEIMDSEPIVAFTPKTASNEIKRLENILIAKGADDTSRKEIIDKAVEIEKTLDGSAKNNDTLTADNEVENTISNISVDTEMLPVKYSNNNEARLAFVAYAKENFPRSVVNTETQAEIGISRTGIDKFLSGNISLKKYASGFKIPELVESATKVGEAENKKGKSGIKGYEYYDNSININGEEFAVHIRVRNTDMGDKYYGHTISRDVEEIKIEPLARNSDEKSVHSVNAFGSDNNTISQDNDAVKARNLNNAEDNMLKKEQSNDIIGENVKESVKYDFGEYDSFGKNIGKDDGEKGNFRTGDNRGHIDYSENPEEKTERSGTADGGKNDDNLQKYERGTVKKVYHGSAYTFKNFEKSYVDVGIHFGSKAQAVQRAGNNCVLKECDLTIENPLECKDIFGERTPGEYVNDIIETSMLSKSQKTELKEKYTSYCRNSTSLETVESLKSKISSGKYQIDTEIDKDGVFVSISLIDDLGNVNQVPMTELIGTDVLRDVLGEKNTELLLQGKEFSELEKKEFSSVVFDTAAKIEMNFLKLRKIEDILKSFGYDGIVYKNENERDGWSYAVFDNSQITENSANADEAEVQNDYYSSKDVTGVDAESRWTTEKASGAENKGVNIADIVESIRDKFGIPIATGKIADRQALGIYKTKPETIRTRIANNLPTISHELGHHLDKKYDLSKLESVKELRKVVSEEFLELYSENKRNNEAVAEFVRIYLKNTNDANRLCPDFYSDFISTLSKEDLKSLNEIASSVNEYLSYNISERYDAAIVSSQKKERVPFKEKWHEWYSNWVDAFHPQKQVVDYVEEVTGKTLSGKKNAYILATNSLNAHTVANFLICEGFRDLDGNIVDAKSFVDSIGMVNSKDIKLLDKYLVLRHSLEWIAPEQEDVAAKRVFADDTLENIEEIKKQIAEIEKAHPEIKTAAENLYEYQNNVIKHFVIPAGGMTEDTLSTLNRKYPSYVPFYRAVGKRSGFAKGTFANQRAPIMKAKGSGALIISPTESIIRNTEKMVKFAMRNQVMGMWADYADTVDGFGQYMEKVAPDMLPHTIYITTQKERFADALQQVVHSGEDYFAISDLFDEIFGNAVSDFTPIANANKRIVTVLIDGKPSYYQIHDEAFYNSIAELSPKQTSGMLKIMNSIMQPMKLLITQNNPFFAATNAIRDYGTAYKLSEINNPVTFAIMYAKALSAIIANSESYKQYKAMGGGHSSELSANIDSIAKTLREVAQKDMGKARRLAYSVFRHPVETIASINDVIESTPRFMEFMRTLENEGDLQEAIYNADDITTNFKRSGKGSTAKDVNNIIMFNNAAIQGVDKMFRTLFTKDTKKRNKTLLKWALHALLIGVTGYIYNKEVDEEGYKNLSSYKKNNFYNYAIGDGKFISLPKPRENAVLDTFTERTIEYLFGDNENAFYDFGSYVSSQLLPPMLPDTLDPVDAVHSVMGSTVLGGLTDVGFNQDFKGTPIEGEYEKYSPSNERYTESTTKLAYGLGQTKLARELDMSPKKIDHIISSYTGVLGQVNKALFPMNDSRRDISIGLRNKFISDSNYSTDVLNRMYENQEKAEKAFEYDNTIETAVEYEQNTILTSYISSMNKAVKALPANEQRNGRAYLLKALNQWEYDNTSSQTEMLKRFSGETVTDDCIITSIPKSTLEWTENKVKYSYQMTPQEYNEYVKEYLNMVDKYRTYQSKNCSNSTDYALALSKTNAEVKKVLSKKYKQKYASKAQKTNNIKNSSGR